MNLSELWYDILENLFQKQIRTYEVKIGSENLHFYPQDIIRIEADGSYSRIITKNKNYTISRNLKYIESIIGGWGFIKVNRSNIINVIHILSVEKKNSSIVMSDNVSIKIPRRVKYQILKKLLQFTKTAGFKLL